MDYRKKLLAGISSLIDAPDAVGGTPQSSAAPALHSGPSRYRVLLTALVAIAVAAFALIEIKQYFDIRLMSVGQETNSCPKLRGSSNQIGATIRKTYALALQAEEIIPNDPDLVEVFETISLRIDIDSDPPGADVYMKNYSSPEQKWTHVGVTPVDGARVPVGIFRWKFEKDGYETVIAAASSWDISMNGNMTNEDLLHPNNIFRQLDPIGAIPPGMVRVAGAQTPQGDIQDFFIDRFEVTKRRIP